MIFRCVFFFSLINCIAVIHHFSQQKHIVDKNTTKGFIDLFAHLEQKVRKYSVADHGQLVIVSNFALNGVLFFHVFELTVHWAVLDTDFGQQLAEVRVLLGVQHRLERVDGPTTLVFGR